MKKNSLTTAVVAGIAGVAGLANVSNAVNLNPDGLGQVLIYPYYTVNGGNNTLISVVNTTDEVKAVKVRFLESLNSREVLDFNLYLSPFDVWTAAVTQASATGPGRIVTTDTSCTVPRIPAAGQDFRNFAYTGSFNDDGVDTLDRTRDGHIEMIEMGVVVDDGDVIGPAFPLPGAPANLSGVDNAVGDSGEEFATDATHVNGVPSNCNSLVASWASGAWATNPAIDFDEPTGGLFGGASIVDVVNGTNLAYNADAIDGFFTIANNASLHTGPGFTLPTLAQAQTTLGEADAIVFDNGNLITLDFVSGRDLQRVQHPGFAGRGLRVGRHLPDQASAPRDDVDHAVAGCSPPSVRERFGRRVRHGRYPGWQHRRHRSVRSERLLRADQRRLLRS
jgi:hypothetical protein